MVRRDKTALTSMYALARSIVARHSARVPEASGKSQMRAVRSSLAVTTRVPSGLNRRPRSLVREHVA